MLGPWVLGKSGYEISKTSSYLSYVPDFTDDIAPKGNMGIKYYYLSYIYQEPVNQGLYDLVFARENDIEIMHI